MAWGLLYKFVLANLAYKVMSLVIAKTVLQVWHILMHMEYICSLTLQDTVL